MTPRTKPFTREDLVAHAKKVLSGHQSVARICEHRSDLAASSRYEADAMEAIVAVLENYPLANPAAESVRIICEDLASRGGFREVVAAMGPGAWKDLQEFLTAKLASTVVYAEPATTPAEGIEMDFA